MQARVLQPFPYSDGTYEIQHPSKKKKVSYPKLLSVHQNLFVFIILFLV